MKVVLFCGGLGLRMRDAENLPKPMVPIGNRPLLWHVMKYYAHHGHKDFVLCLGWRAEVIKNYFLHFDECLTNDFVLTVGSRSVELLSRDIDDWRITFCDAGIHANIGQRLLAARRYLEGETEFLANYSDGLSDLPLPAQLAHFRESGKVASFLCVRPNLSYHVVRVDQRSRLVDDIHPIDNGELRVNGGFFAFRADIFDYLREGEELVEEPFHRLVHAQQLVGYAYDGFWASMDTFKDRQHLESLHASGRAPWEVWKQPAAGRGAQHRQDNLSIARLAAAA